LTEQQLIERDAGLHGIDEQQDIDCRAISGPKQPPNVAKRKANSNTMGLALRITVNHITNSGFRRCDIHHEHTRQQKSRSFAGFMRHRLLWSNQV